MDASLLQNSSRLVSILGASQYDMRNLLTIIGMNVNRSSHNVQRHDEKIEDGRSFGLISHCSFFFFLLTTRNKTKIAAIANKATIGRNMSVPAALAGNVAPVLWEASNPARSP
jgi:hypothetical protein